MLALQPSVPASNIVNQSELDLCFLGKSWCWGIVSCTIPSDKDCGLAGVPVLCEVVLQEHRGSVSGETPLVQAFSGMVLKFTEGKHPSPGVSGPAAV